MNKKAIRLLFLLVLCSIAAVVVLSKCMKDPLAKYIENQTNYTVYNCVCENGEIDVVIEFQTIEKQELYAQYCTRIVLCSIKQFPFHAEDYPKEVTVRLYNKTVKQTVLRISVKGDAFLKVSWESLNEAQIPNNVNYYYFNDKVF